ncbi:tRNA-dihydrouridine(20a/20b) synthase [NAD(P)+]-like [Acanthaster planci]|uniref:tRNA-dihydrouridine synthase n=1 Tax=Acanthaster planci TaxID=133434 RepID=A0A8B7YQV0_ACAPL|nr:tRNA-dihydrouridine(20a/20b) synthase [NAD(P)+]-like [Acanthaster planci]XP_022095654.1 tRNA-dihydrouridine(20a/20b) synthase [NAD(P)+]-like [Acanthaster planci]
MMAHEEQSSDKAIQHQSLMDLLDKKKPLKICAPMVRYSKLAFRTLVRRYGCDLTFTPMIMSNSFVRSMKARDNEFTTNKGDRPLIVQFAANNGKDLADAAELIAPYADGVDLNCGCPQRWAMCDGYGAHLIKNPELIRDMVRQTKARVGRADFTTSIKIRIHPDLRDTVDLCQKAETAGVSWIAVHGRTPRERAEPANHDAIKLIKESVGVPVIANGDIRSLEDMQRVCDHTNVDGVMAARGILENPAMFAGYNLTPTHCVQQWLDISLSLGTPFQCFHHHLIYMMEKMVMRADKRVFNVLTSTAAVVDYLEENYGIHPSTEVSIEDTRGSSAPPLDRIM